jgi:50S ribosomal protein L16 3-hydroxylase
MENQRGLSSLITPQSSEEFLLRHWPKNPFVVHGLRDSIAAITRLDFLQSLEAILLKWPDLIQVHLPEVRDESHSFDASREKAREAFANKMSLLFNNVQKISPELKSWLIALQNDLGLPASTFARCIVYATPDGMGTAAHFDQNINFVLQIHGIKKWRIAKNQSVENPTQRFTIGQPIDPELRIYLESEMPREMPKESEEYILKPGSLLFLPRGYWHCTEAEGSALALNFTFSQPTWIDLFTLALRSRLSLSAEWRELADGVSSRDADRRASAQLKFDELLIELVHDLPNWRAEDILGSTEGDFETSSGN